MRLWVTLRRPVAYTNKSAAVRLQGHALKGNPFHSSSFAAHPPPAQLGAAICMFFAWYNSIIIHVYREVKLPSSQAHARPFRWTRSSLKLQPVTGPHGNKSHLFALVDT